MTKTISLGNGYAISVRKEKISHEGRSIFRDIDSEQIVLQILNPDGRVTKRLPIPASAAEELRDCF